MTCGGIPTFRPSSLKEADVGRVLAAIIAHPLRKVCGATNAGRELSIATARLVDLDLAVMWDCTETVNADGLKEHRLQCWNRMGPFASCAPRFTRVPLYDSDLPELVVRGNYSLVHIHNMIPAFAAQRLAETCMRHNIPYVISTHGFYEITRYAAINSFGAIKSALAHLVITRPFRHAVRGAAAIFALSDCERDLLAGLGVEDSKIHIVTNGINEFYLQPPAADELRDVRTKFGIGSDPVLLYMGSLHAYKGVDVFLRSLRTTPLPFRAVVAGKFKDDRERATLLRNAGLDDERAARVVFTGAVSNAELRSLYGSADVFVYPTLGDTLPLVVLEAMACGLPVVSTTVGGIPFAVRPDCGILLPPGDAAAVSEAVTFLLSAPEQRRAMGINARKRVEETFRWSAAARQAVAGYQAVTQRRCVSAAAFAR